MGLGVLNSESVIKMARNGVFNVDFSQLLFVGSFYWVSARYLHVFVAGCEPILNYFQKRRHNT